jgi:hypothetical protein
MPGGKVSSSARTARPFLVVVAPIKLDNCPVTDEWLPRQFLVMKANRRIASREVV